MSEFRLGELLEERAGQGYKLYARHSNPVFVRMLKIIGFDREWASAEGAYLIDRDGTRFLDMLGGFGMFNVGRNNPTVRRALEEALALGTPNLPQLGLSDLPGLLAEALCAVAPASTDRVLFTNSGAESIEAAIKLGRAATGRTRIVANLGGFHGLTLGALSINGSPVFRERFEPLLPGVALVPFNDLEALEAELRSEDVALFVVEPVQGHGVHLPEPGYLEGAQELCRRYGTLFCVDEVQTGFGRTGKLFALEHWGLEPDLVTTAKSLSGGYVAAGALLLRRTGARGRLRLARARHGARLHLRAERPRDGGRPRDAARARRQGPRRALGAHGRAAARAHAPARRAVRGGEGGARARPAVGDRVRGAGLAAALVAAARADPARLLLAARDRAALLEAPRARARWPGTT